MVVIHLQSVGWSSKYNPRYLKESLVQNPPGHAASALVTGEADAIIPVIFGDGEDIRNTPEQLTNMLAFQQGKWKFPQKGHLATCILATMFPYFASGFWSEQNRS